jgi:hypothetical protein
MSSLKLDNPVEESRGFGIRYRTPTVTPSVKLTREFYIRRLAVALLLTGRTDIQDQRKLRAAKCIANTPQDELAEARLILAELERRGFVEDGIFL